MPLRGPPQQPPSPRAPRSFIAGTPTAPLDLPSFYKRLAAATPAQLPCQMGLMALSRNGGDAGASGDGGQAPPGPGPRPAPAPAGEADGPQRWLVANALCGGAARELAVRTFRGSGAKMVPWVGLAARLDAEGPAAAAAAAAAAAGKGSGPGGQAPGGRAFCFLPLPIATGLPLHVNGYFELSSNRRDIWCGGELCAPYSTALHCCRHGQASQRRSPTQGPECVTDRVTDRASPAASHRYGRDMAGSGAARSEWNVALLRDGLAPLYGRLLAAVAAREGPGPKLYRRGLEGGNEGAALQAAMRPPQPQG